MEAGSRVGFLGAGRMASALARGWIAAGLTTADRVLASDPVPAARDAFCGGGSLRAIPDNREVVAHGDLLVSGRQAAEHEGVDGGNPAAP